MKLHSASAFLLISFMCFTVSAQEFDASYYKKLASSNTNTSIRLKAMDSILAKTFRTDPKTFIAYSLEYISLAKEVDSIAWAAKKAMNLQHPLTNYNNDPGKAVTVLSNVISHKYKLKDSFLLGGLYLKRGRAHLRIDLKDAVEDFTLAIDNFGRKDSIHKADAYLFRGQAYSNQGKFIKASEDYNKAHSLFESLKDYEYMLLAQQGNITMYSMNGFYDKAKEERDSLVEKLKELELHQYLATLYYNQALDYKKMGEPSLELDYLLQAKQIFNDSLSDKVMYVAIHSSLVEYYSNKNDVDKAQKNMELIENVYATINGDLYTDLNYNNAKAIVLKNNGQFEEALKYAQKRLNNAKTFGIEEETMSSYLLLAEIYDEIDDFKNSYENKSAYITLKDSLYNAKSANAFAYYQTALEIEKKEKELVEKNTNIQLLEKDNDTFKKMVGFSSIAVLLGFILVILYRNQSHLKTNKVLQERFSQELLASQEVERKRISKDLHDGLGQQLLLIKNKIVEKGDSTTKQMVDAAIDEVRSISRDLHPFQLQEMGITKAIEFTLNQIDENTSLFISSDIDNIDNVFSKEGEINIYRIVQESLSNVLKHAKAEASKVSVKRFANNIIISIRDNGIGFDFAEEYQDVKSLGLKTLLERTKFLKGQMKVYSRKDSGTVLEFQFPVS
ncbi:tetratricopeptide repeat-containing sensor histidine kinase [Cochleicola gelatinilyticus]|nr:ATP-binding protein [Cochleicola gelatinilyticus]